MSLRLWYGFVMTKSRLNWVLLSQALLAMFAAHHSPSWCDIIVYVGVFLLEREDGLVCVLFVVVGVVYHTERGRIDLAKTLDTDTTSPLRETGKLQSNVCKFFCTTKLEFCWLQLWLSIAFLLQLSQLSSKCKAWQTKIYVFKGGPWRRKSRGIVCCRDWITEMLLDKNASLSSFYW